MAGANGSRRPRGPHALDLTCFTISTDGCWLWNGQPDKDGYGKICFYGSRMRAHRAMWEFCFGQIDDGLLVLHSCDTPATPAEFSKKKSRLILACAERRFTMSSAVSHGRTFPNAPGT